MKLSRNPNTNWADNRLQFPRLIAEMQADGVFTNEVIGNLAIAMDLQVERVHELIDRACNIWDEIKARL